MRKKTQKVCLGQGEDAFYATKKNCKVAASKKKVLKILGASGLALFMGIGTLCGVLLAPASAAQANANTQAGVLAGHNASGAAAKAAHDAAILSGGDLGLDPENDPIVWVTDNGLEIKSHDFSVSSGTTTVSSTSWKYVTLGSYNWIIIGYSTNSATQGTGNATVSTAKKYERNNYTTWLTAGGINSKLVPESSTPAGSAILTDIHAGNDSIYITSSFTYKLQTIFTNAVGNSEIPASCVLCLCAGTTGEAYYDNTSPYQAYFPSSDLDTAMTTVYNSIKSAAGGAIQSTPLTTYWYNGSAATKYTHSEYLFPLATNEEWDSSTYPQNYCVETYLSTTTKRSIDAWWWLRSGNANLYASGYYVNASGKVNDYYCDVYDLYDVRPAFVLSLA